MPRDLTSFKMYAQIQRQPTELARLLEAPEPVAEAAALLHRAGRVFTVGIGTSSNAALTAATLLRLAGLEATAWTSYDFALYGPALRASDAAVLFSHSGRKQQSRATLQRLATANVPAVWVAGAGAEENPATVTLRTVPRETSAAFTISHTAAMLLTARLAEALQPGVVGDLAALPAAVHEALGLDATVRALAEAWQDVGSIIAVGRGRRSRARTRWRSRSTRRRGCGRAATRPSSSCTGPRPRCKRTTRCCCSRRRGRRWSAAAWWRSSALTWASRWPGWRRCQGRPGSRRCRCRTWASGWRRSSRRCRAAAGRAPGGAARPGRRLLPPR